MIKQLNEFYNSVTFFNQYFQNKQPWKSISTSNNTIWISINATRALAIILYPIIPFSAEKIWHQLGYENDLSKQDWYSSSEILIEKDHLLSQNIEPIFKKIEKDDIDKQKASLIESSNSVSI